MVLHGWHEGLVDELDEEVEVEAEEDEFEVTLEELLDERENCFVQFLVLRHVLQVLVEDALEDLLADLSQRLVLVVLANSEVDVLAPQEVQHHTHKYFQILVDLFVPVVVPQWLPVTRKALIFLQESAHGRDRLLEHDESIDGPGVELQSARRVVHQVE